ncbi:MULTISPECIES: glycoside hydrolase family protein [unclassified Cupriavidus]|uniref:glycoside hydrolase family protein n=1 Tax=unclassified Cupriavidus TaxID=2640874 RepID=UPI000E99209B|nr:MULTISPECIES: glycoside hydrolase family protein [unclassified Cupriavidus]HBO83133.1 lysozyme [Cupriavidus sp.]
MNYDKLKAQLAVDEGTRRRRYRDSRGFWTIGRGHNIDADPHYPYTLADEPLNDAQIDGLEDRDIAAAVGALDQYANWWRAMEEPRQRVICNMCFNMGWGKLAGFVNTLQAMHFANYAAAAQGMRTSLWASQVGDRAERLAKIMETGEG